LDYPYYRRAKAMSERKGGKVGLMLSGIVTTTRVGKTKSEKLR
jgi:hypothetical protein